MYDKDILGVDGSKTSKIFEATDQSQHVFMPGELFDFINFLILLHTNRIAQYENVFAKTEAHHPIYGFSSTSIADGKAMRQQLGRMLIGKGGLIKKNPNGNHLPILSTASANDQHELPEHLLTVCYETEKELVKQYELAIYSDWPIDEDVKALFVQQHKLMARSLKTVAYLQRQLGASL